MKNYVTKQIKHLDEDGQRRWNERRTEIETALAEKKGGTLLVNSYTYIPLSASLQFLNCKKGYQYIEEYRSMSFQTLRERFYHTVVVEVETGKVGVIDAVICNDVANGTLFFKTGMEPARTTESLLVQCLSLLCHLRTP
jgi:hypothetical protein